MKPVVGHGNKWTRE